MNLKEPHTDWLKGVEKGDRKSQFQLYKHCHAAMMRWSLRYTNNRDDAEACTNQSFLKVCEHIKSFTGKGPFEEWLKRITINTAIDAYRREARKRKLIETRDDQQMPSSLHSENSGSQQLDAESVRQLLNQLPPVSKRAFALCALDGYAYEEASALLNITENTCRWHVHHARKLLQEALKNSNENAELIGQ